MQIIKPSFEILHQQPHGLEGIYKQIEIAGRICYKSHDKMTDDNIIGTTSLWDMEGQIESFVELLNKR